VLRGYCCTWSHNETHTHWLGLPWTSDRPHRRGIYLDNIELIWRQTSVLEAEFLSPSSLCTFSVLISMSWLSWLVPLSLQHKHPCPWWDSKPQSQHLSADLSLRPYGHRNRPKTCPSCIVSYKNLQGIIWNRTRAFLLGDWRLTAWAKAQSTEYTWEHKSLAPGRRGDWFFLRWHLISGSSQYVCCVKGDGFIIKNGE
jgi:hypothetical protein